jgi:tetratricopeptide (TPR) repeat protein
VTADASENRAVEKLISNRLTRPGQPAYQSPCSMLVSKRALVGGLLILLVSLACCIAGAGLRGDGGSYYPKQKNVMVDSQSEDEGRCFICLESSEEKSSHSSSLLRVVLWISSAVLTFCVRGGLPYCPMPIQCGCACRGAAGLAHGSCRVKAADCRGGGAWWKCQTCRQPFTGEMQYSLAQARWRQVCNRKEEDNERVEAANNLATSLWKQGRHSEAEAMHRELLAVLKRVLGAEHPNTLAIASNLASSLWSQGRHEDAEAMHREVLAVLKRVLGAEHPNTLTTASNLANSLLSQEEKHAEAEAMHRELLVMQKRVLGSEHPNTLATASNLASSLWSQGKHAEAEAMQREVLAVPRQKRLLGCVTENGASH